MAKYIVHVPLFASTTIEIKAKNKKEALEKAFDEAGEPILCHQCSSEVDIIAVNDDIKKWDVTKID